MPKALHLKIADILLRSRDLTQRGLAEAMGLDPAAINRMLAGARKIKADEIPVIEQYLRQKITPSSVTVAGVLPLVPVYRLADHGQSRQVADYISPHPLSGADGGLAFYIPDEAMAPRYKMGEVAYVHRHRPARAGDDVIAELNGGGYVLGQLVKRDDKALTLAFLNERLRRVIRHKDIAALYVVVGRG